MAVSTVEADAQSFLERLGRRVQRTVEDKVIDKAEDAAEKAVDKVTDPETYKGDGSDQQQGQTQQQQGNAPATVPMGVPADAGQQVPAAQTPQQGGQSALEMTYAKNDFVPGDEIIFDDPMDAEQLGEFPSMWDLYSGNAEVASVGGKKAIMFSERATLGPLMKVPKNYLGDIFTVEFDFLFPEDKNNPMPFFQMIFHSPDNNNELMMFNRSLNSNDLRQNWSWASNNGKQNGSGELSLSNNVWHHVSVSFNKRAWKFYIDGVRYVNVPNVANPPGWFDIRFLNNNGPLYVTNLRIAKGAVPLYDRMMSDGKFITYGITFDVGKSTIKPESMGEINRIVQLMNENPTLRFSVEGHTDSTGNAASNQTLSEARSAAIVAKLVEMGIAADRLSASGKGQNSPIADNATDEGRAKNRRVEFVKIN